MPGNKYLVASLNLHLSTSKYYKKSISNQVSGRVQKMLNSSYGPNPEISNLATFSETRQPDFGAKSIYFAI